VKERYLRWVRTIAENDLDWNKIEPVVRQYRDRIDEDVQDDTRKLDSYEAFTRGLGLDAAATESRDARGRRTPSLREFVEQRRAFLLAHADVKDLKPLTNKETDVAR
jgi:hypothetical protein